MKLTLIILFTLVLITICEARYTESFTHNIVDTITNKTSQFTNYVKTKGRSLKQFYVDNVKNKLTSYLGWTGKSETVGSDVERANRRFKGYLEEAEANNQSVFDAIAPEKTEYNCNDDDPTIHMTTPQLIAANGYHSESHTIVTDDGYILTVHRIPYSKKDENKVVPKRTVLCHHGLLGSSVDWVMAGPEKGLGYILSDAGYDVWLTNVRGNTYSKAHVSLNTDTFQFWNFTFHEVAQHDLPSVINYIMDLKGKDAKIDYIGHSMGTTILFALLSTKPEYNDILRAGFALAPVAYMTDIRSPINLLARYSSNLEYLLKLLGANEFLPQNSVLRWLSRHACEVNHWEEAICENSLFVICGHDSKQFNKTLLPMILGHTPAGASTKTLVHYAQEISNAGRFQQFDYGKEGNLREYGTAQPPAYPLHKITLPVALFGALNDWLASDKDVTELYVQLANPIEHYIVPLKEFNHIDFLYAIDAPTLVYDKLLQLMRRDLGKFRVYSDPVVQNYLYFAAPGKIIIEARYTESFTHNIVDTITNKTSQFTNYVKTKGRSLKQFYVDNVKNKLTSYLGWTGKSETVGSDVERANRRFKGYLEEAEANNQSVFDAIAPEKTEYNCNDDDPTIHMTTPQLIAANGYHSESHTIVTDDGYILTVHRIPYSKKDENKVVPKRTVLCHHGLLGSSVDWVMAGPEKGLGYILSDAGYDVWLTNVRGNTYSKAHVSLNTDTFQFWNFTFHEVAQHDLPSVINYIMDLKGKDAKIDYIGHSMGTTILFALLSTKPEYNDILRAGFALAPVAYMTDIRSPINLLARYSSNLEYLLKLLGANEFLPQNSVLRWLSRHACEVNHWEEAICENSLFVICGHDSKQFNKTLLPMILGHTPAGASTKTLVHYAQEISNAGRFQQFDYGKEGNLREYGTAQPPAYPLHKITLPVALFGALNDWLASDKDVTELYVQLANPIEHYIVPLKEFNHIDFLYAIDAPTLVYDKLLQLMRRDLGKFRVYSDPVVQNYL